MPRARHRPRTGHLSVAVWGCGGGVDAMLGVSTVLAGGGLGLQYVGLGRGG